MFALPALAAGKANHIVVIVWDGLRPDSISESNTPTLRRLADSGVMFENHHSVYCTATVVNGTAIATGAHPQRSGVMANTDFRPEINALKGVGLNSLDVARKGDELTGGHYLPCPTLVEVLRDAGLRSAVAGSKDVALMFDRKERTNDLSLPVNLFGGKTLPPTALKSITNLLGSFPRAENERSLDPNEKRDEWTTSALLGPMWTNGVPSFSLLWLSEPDFSQHAAGPGSLKAVAALKSSDRQLNRVLRELERRNVRESTDVFVVSDHGFSTVEHAVDVCGQLQKAGFRAQREFKSTPQTGEILVIGQGASVVFYVFGRDAKVTDDLVTFLQKQPFSGVIFTREKLEGTFALSSANINSPNPPDVVLSMRWSATMSGTGTEGQVWSDGGRQPGGGTHASLSRYDVHNTLVAAGPDFKRRFNNTMPTANTDLAPTILWLLGVQSKEPMDGRVLSEALTIDAPPATRSATRRLEATRSHGRLNWSQYLQISQVNDTVYIDEGNGVIADQ